MRRLIFIVSIASVLISCGPPKLSMATNFDLVSATIFFENGTKKTGNVEFPINSSDSKIKIKYGKETEKIDKKTVDKLIYTTSSGELEYYNLKIYKLSKKIKKDKKLVCLSMKGKVSLYYSQGSGWEQRGNMQVPVYFTEYYCKRENEEAATLIHIENGVVNKNAVFRYQAKRYFSDDAEIVAKIENKEYTYKNMVEMIAYYNSK
jgi:hypothetical protein